MKYKQSLQLDISGIGRPKKITAKQWDTESRVLEVVLTADGAPFALPEGAAVRLRATKPDNTCVLNDCQIENGIVVIPLTEQLLAASGIVRADLAIYEGESLLSTTHFIIQVIHAPIDYEAVESKDEFTALNNALITIEESAAMAENAAASIEGLMDDCELSSSAANQSAARAAAAAQEASSAAQRADTAAEACNAFIEQEIGDVVDAAIGNKVEGKVEEAVTGIVGKPNGVAGLDSSGKVTPMPTAEDVGAAKAAHSHTVAEVTGTVPVTKGGTGAVTAAAALVNLGAAAASHQHKVSDLNSGTLPIARGGTGASTAALARYALGLGNTSGPVPVANGGTGASTASAALQNLGAQPVMEDSGWIAVPLAEGVAARNTGGFETPMYRNFSGHIIIQGGVTVQSGKSAVTIGTLPSAFRPATTVHKMVPCGGQRIARIYITPLGEIVLEWMMNIADGSVAEVNQWLTLNIDYYKL